jgi:GNAT superfamily N-acetyltransferase
MNGVLTDLSNTLLVSAIKSNFYGWFLACNRSPGTESFSAPKLTCWHTRIPIDLFQGILIQQPAADGDGTMLRAALDFFTSRGVTALTCWPDTDVPTASWEAPLSELGFTPAAGPPGMAIDLAMLQERRQVSADFRIATVEDPATLRDWIRAFIPGFGLPEAWSDPLHELVTGKGLDLPMRYYIGYLDGKPVATSSLFLGAGVAGVYSVATLPEARGKGIGTAMTAAPLKDAREMGYRAGILEATAMGYPIYEKMGFRKLCSIDHFSWKSPQ